MITIGLMSGTSLDGVDAVAMEFPEDSARPMRLLGSVSTPMPRALGRELLALAVGTTDEIERAGDASVELARTYAQTVEKLLKKLEPSGVARSDVRALGAHGQTIRHRPERGFTVQILQGALLAELTGIDVVCDLRSRDVAAGGEGAPLVPAFHAAVFRNDRPSAVLNVGGIANFTLLPALSSVAPVLGFDSGPGNMLLDHWMRTRCGEPFDRGGDFARTGAPDEALLAEMLEEPYFARPAPKSTGRELFSPEWLGRFSSRFDGKPQDMAATLTELTARSAAQALMRSAPDTEKLYICGGGALNALLCERLLAALGSLGSKVRKIESTAIKGLEPLEVEGAAFAWLARAFLEGIPGNLPAVTRARGPRILGALYPAGPMEAQRRA